MRYDSWESYFYPETYDPTTGQGVMRNLYDEHNAQLLARREYVSTSVRAHELTSGQVILPRTYDAVHVRAVHAHLFQDVYEWAGQYRSVNMSKNFSSFANAHTGEIDQYLRDMHHLVKSTRWAELDREGFAQSSATIFAYLNQAHPFREGNGRTSKVFMEHVAEQSHFTLDFSQVTPLVWNQASMLSGPDLGSYKPVPDSLIPVFYEIAQPRLKLPEVLPQPGPNLSMVRAAFPTTTPRPTRAQTGSPQQSPPPYGRKPEQQGRGNGPVAGPQL